MHSTMFLWLARLGALAITADLSSTIRRAVKASLRMIRPLVGLSLSVDVIFTVLYAAGLIAMWSALV